MDHVCSQLEKILFICDRYNRMFAAKEAAKQELLRTKGDVSAARSLYVLGLHHKQRVCSLNVMDFWSLKPSIFAAVGLTINEPLEQQHISGIHAGGCNPEGHCGADCC